MLYLYSALSFFLHNDSLNYYLNPDPERSSNELPTIIMYTWGWHGGTKDEVVTVFHNCEKGLCTDVIKVLKEGNRTVDRRNCLQQFVIFRYFSKP